MTLPISSLANMEMALYGGFGTNAAAPSYLNGYMGGTNSYSSYMNPSFYGYGYGNGYNNTNNTVFGQTIPQGYANNTQQQQASVFQGLTNAEVQSIVDDYAKSLTPSEGFLSCAVTNGLFAAAMNPRLIVHPYNTIKTLGSVNEVFADVKKAGSALNKLWVKPENSNILREAYLQLHKAEARKMKKLGAFRRSYLHTGANASSEVAIVDNLTNELKAAIKAGDMKKITESTAKLQQAYSVNNGFITRGWRKVKGLFTEVKPISVSEKLKDTEAINKLAKKLVDSKQTSYMNMLKRGGGVKGGLMFAGLELVMSLGKIKTAFGQDNETGMKQLGQTTVKAAGNAAGWALGEAAGVWAFTKLGASIGTAFGPGIGTLIGGAVGLIGGGLGMWLAGKATKAIVGRDVADDVEAKKLAQNQEGQVQLLQNTLTRMQKGEKVSAQAQQATMKLVSLYA